MCSTRAAVLLLLFAVICIPGEAVFTLLSVELTECLQSQCVEKTYACQKRYGLGLTGEVKGCVAESCKGDVIRCMKGVMQRILAASTSETPLVSPEDQHLIEMGMVKTVDSFFHCYTHSDPWNTVQFIDCFLGDLLDKAEPYMNMFSSLLGTPEAGLVSCWLKKALRKMVSCFKHVDQAYYTTLEHNMKMETIFNSEEHISCYDKIFREKKCFQMFARSYPSYANQVKRPLRLLH
ncbi:uncharacterized protein LOC118812993 isoform X2 [Colossoma macropomum]|uniref:uncharacterized protein LOC118812993 isoform X2 n=1 Tax=Colossoma macropomum TaxID=42526 RepID=UPI0018644FD5|nr:uncharacterized protein LOC118812993 isoform X2 [Colossoma macropomum]